MVFNLGFAAFMPAPYSSDAWEGSVIDQTQFQYRIIAKHGVGNL